MMETEESNRCATPCKTMKTQDEALNKSFPPHWSAPIQVYHNSGSTATPFVNSYAAEFSLHPNIWENQKYNIPFQYGTQNNNRSLSSHISDGAALTISEREKSIFNGKEIDSRTLCDGNLQPGSIIPGKSKENGNGSSVPDSARDRPPCLSSNEGHSIDDSDNNEFLIKKRQCDAMLANGDAAENFNTVPVSRNFASEEIPVHSAKPRLSKLEEDQIRRERKRQLNRESARRSRIRKQQELEELQNRKDSLIRETSAMKKNLLNLSEDCMELSHSNDAIEKEIVEKYGPDAIADLLPFKPARISSDESHSQGSDRSQSSTDFTRQP